MSNNDLTFKIFGKDVSASKTLSGVGSKDKKELGDIGKVAAGVFAGFTLSSLTGKIQSFASHSISAFSDTAAQVRGLQRIAGGSAEGMSRLLAAANMTGVGSEKLSTGIGLLSKHLVANDAAAKSLGISYRDAHGKLLPMDQLLPKISDKFSKMHAGPEKTALALKLFGKGGKDLLPLLNKGADGMKKLGDESDKAGTTLSGKDLAATLKNTQAKKKLHEQVQGLQISFGRVLLPALTSVTSFMTNRVLPAIKSVIGWIGSHKPVLIAVAAVIGVGLVAAFVSWAIAAGAAAIATLAATWPIIAIVAVIALLVAGLVLAWNHCKTFRDIVKGAMHIASAAFHGVLKAVGKVVEWIKAHWPLLLAIITGPIGLAVKFIVDHWQQIKDGATTAVRWIGGKFSWFVGFIKGLPGKIASAAKGLFNGIGNAFISAINFIIGVWDALHFSAPSFSVFGHKVGGFTIGLPQIPKIPMLATGGVLTSGGRVIVGERGAEMLDLPTGARVTPLAGRNAARGEDTHVHLHFDGQIMPGVEAKTAQSLFRLLREQGARGVIPQLVTA